MTGSDQTAIARTYGVNCFINTRFPGPPNDDGSYDFVRFVYTADTTGSGQPQPNPNAHGNGDRVTVKIPNGVNGQPFLFTICDYGNLADQVLLTNIAVDLKVNTSVWLFTDHNPLSFQDTGGQGGLQANQSAVSPDGPSIMWSGPLHTTFLDLSSRKGAVMEYTVSVTVKVVSALDLSSKTLTFRADPQMQVDPN